MQIIPTTLQRYFTKKRIRKRFEEVVGYKPNLESPRSYCEKIQWLKLNYLEHNPLVVQCADKYRVRDYLEKQGLGEFLVTLYGCWDAPEEIPWSSLPNRFVLKLNNGSGGKYRWLVPDKNTLDKTAMIRQMKKSMRIKYGYKHGEFYYSKMPTKIMAEELLTENDAPFRDYKFYCFNGAVSFLSIEQNRETNEHVRDYYDTDLNIHPIKFVGDLEPPDEPFEKPENFGQMVDLAKRLSTGYSHLRVDLYNVNGRVYFGELTFSPECGYTPWDPIQLDYEYGERIDLDLARSFLA